MNMSRIIWGIVFLVLAALLGVLSLTLPADSLMFTVGEENMPWVPAVILGILGFVFLAAGVRGKQGA